MVWIVEENSRLEQVRWMLHGMIEIRRERTLTKEEEEKETSLYEELFKLQKEEKQKRRKSTKNPQTE